MVWMVCGETVISVKGSVCTRVITLCEYFLTCCVPGTVHFIMSIFLLYKFYCNNSRGQYCLTLEQDASDLLNCFSCPVGGGFIHYHLLLLSVYTYY